MTRFFIAFALMSCVSVFPVKAADSLAEVSYRRSPTFLNGEHVTGVWHLVPGDTVSTGGGRAYATAKYLDSTRIGVMPDANVVFQQGWVDLIAGPLDIDVVSGTKHVEQIESAAGIAILKSTTGVFGLGELQTDGSREVSFNVKLGEIVFQVARDHQAVPLYNVYVGKGGVGSVVVSEGGHVISVKVTRGSIRVRSGSDSTVTFPALSRGGIICLPDSLTARVVATRGTLDATDKDGKTSTVAQDSTASIAWSPQSADQLTLSRRGGDYQQTATETLSAAAVKPASSYSGKLPQDHEYQRILRDFMATLTEGDLDPGVHELTVTPPGDDNEELFRTWLLSLDRIPRIGRKRSAPSVSAPARLFLLKTIEGDEAIMRPPAWPEPLSWFANWDYEGNPYHGSAALQRRAFVTAAVLLMMIDDAQENTPERGVCRTDWMAHHLVLFSYTYSQVRDVLPNQVQNAYLAGVRKITERMLQWGPKGEEPGMDMAAAVGLYYAAEVLADPKIRKAVETYCRRLFTDPEFFNPAGYFVDHGGYDASLNGQVRFYAVWLAMVSGYDFTLDPLRSAYRLRAHLSLPEPDGTITGPTHFNTSKSRDAYHDQYEWRFRDYSGAMLTDEAAHLAKLPTDEELASGGQLRVLEFTRQLKENPGYAKPEDLTVQPWSFRPWPNSWSFPQVINYAHDYYRTGSYAHLAELKKNDSPMLMLPLLREDSFIRHFETEFTVSRNDQFAAVLHTGTIAADTRPGIHKYDGPYGFGGGQLSAFWTLETGSVILGRRAGMNYDRTYDHLDEWRQWPIHAVSGIRHDGRVFTTARIRQPEVLHETIGNECTVQVTGSIPVEMLGQGKVLEHPIAWQRRFTIAQDRLQIETQLRGSGENKLSELVETIPVYLRDLQYQRKLPPTQIEFRVGEMWTPAVNEYQPNVTAVRLSRFEGKVRFTFARPRRVKLSSADWQDTYMSRAACRNIMIDLLDGDESGVVFHAANTSYAITTE